MADVFKALADAGRRALLDSLRRRDGQSLTELSTVLPTMTRYGVSAHLDVLERAELVVSVREGRRKLHYLNAVPLVEMSQRWLSEFTHSTASDLIAFRNHIQEDQLMGNATKPDVVFVIHIRAPRERVWEALTSTDAPRPWLYGSVARSTWQVGVAYEISADGFVMIAGEVLAVDRPGHLRLTFDARWDDAVAAEPAGVLDYRLDETPGEEASTRLTVTLSGLRGESASSAAADTPHIYSSLKSLLETGRAL